MLILMKSNSVKVSFNVPVENNYSNTHFCLIHECNASLVNELVSMGFSCFMGVKGLSIEHYK